MTRLIVVALLLTLAGAAASSERRAAGAPDPAGTPGPSRPGRTAWVYDLPDLAPPVLDAALDQLVGRGVTRLFLSIEDGARFRLDDRGSRAAVARAVAAAAARGVEVHAMLLQHTRWLDDPDGAARRAAAAAGFGRNPGEQPFAGLHLDVEPHTLEAWECGGPEGRARLLDRLADLVRVARRAAHRQRPGVTEPVPSLHPPAPSRARSLGQGPEGAVATGAGAPEAAADRDPADDVRPLPLSVAIPWWVLQWADDSTRAAARRLADAVDEVVLMAYGEPGGPLVGGKPDRLVCRLGLPRLLDRLPGSTRLSVGLAGYEYPDPATLDANADRLDRRLALHPAYGGVALFLAAAPPGTPLVVSIRGRVVGPGGRPLQDATVTVRAAPGAAGEPPAVVPAKPSGQASRRRAGPRVGEVPPGSSGVPAELPGSAEWTGRGGAATDALPRSEERSARPREGGEGAGTGPGARPKGRPDRLPAPSPEDEEARRSPSPREHQEGGAHSLSATTTTNRCGRFVVRLPSPGAATLVAEAPGLRAAVELTGLVAGREQEVGTLVLARPAERARAPLSEHLADAAGHPPPSEHPAGPPEGEGTLDFAGSSAPPDPALPPQAVPLAEARALALARRDAEAEAAYRAVLARWPEELEARLGLARLAAWQGRYAEAAAAYRAILQERCDAAEALLGLADLARWRGQREAAAQLYAEVAADWPHEPAAFLGLGRLALETGRLEAARAHLARALALDPSDAEARRLLARAGRGTP